MTNKYTITINLTKDELKTIYEQLHIDGDYRVFEDLAVSLFQRIFEQMENLGIVPDYSEHN